MGFWDSVAKGARKANDYAGKKMNKLNDSYEQYSERYSNMSNEQLKREIRRLQNDHSIDRFEKVGRLKAMKEELDNRR